MLRSSTVAWVVGSEFEIDLDDLSAPREVTGSVIAFPMDIWDSKKSVARVVVVLKLVGLRLLLPFGETSPKDGWVLSHLSPLSRQASIVA